MESRKTSLIKEELDDVKELIELNKNLIEDFPKDDILKDNLNNLINRENILLDEIKESYLNKGAELKGLNIIGKNVGNGEISLNIIGQICYTIQSLITSLSLDKDIKENAKIPLEYVDATRLNIVGITSGSVKILLKKENNNIIKNDEDLLDKSFNKLQDIIKCGDDEKLLAEEMNNLSDKVKISYRKFLDSMEQTKTSLEFYDFKSNNVEIPIVKISNTKAKRIHEKFIHEETKEKRDRISGVLRVIDADQRIIKVKKKDGARAIVIKFNEEDENIVSEYKVNSKITIDVSDKIIKNPFKNKSHHERLLKRFV